MIQHLKENIKEKASETVTPFVDTKKMTVKIFDWEVTGTAQKSSKYRKIGLNNLGNLVELL